jgi:hypothetical protein
MAQVSEEVIVKMGMDIKDLQRNAAVAKREVREVGEYGRKSFLHAQSSAKSFHRVIEQLNERVPLLGTAFQALTSPIGAAFTAGAVAIGLFNKSLDSLGALMDAVSSANSKSLGDLGKAAGAALKEIRAEEKAFKELAADLIDPMKDVEQSLARQQALLKRNYDLAKARLALEKEAAAEAIKNKEAAGQITPAQAEQARHELGTHYTVAEARLRQGALKKQAAADQKTLSIIDAARKKVAGDVIEYGSPAAMASRFRRALTAHKAEGEIGSLEEQLKAQQEIVAKTAPMATAFERAKQGGLLEKAMTGLEYGVSSITGEVRESLAQNAAAKDRIAAIQAAIAHRKALQTRLDTESDEDKEKNAQRVKDLKELDAAHDRYAQKIEAAQGEISEIGQTPIALKPSAPAGWKGALAGWKSPMLNFRSPLLPPPSGPAPEQLHDTMKGILQQLQNTVPVKIVDIAE